MYQLLVPYIPPRVTATHQTPSKSTSFAVEYSHVAVTTVLKIRSLASGSVLYSSWMKSVKADCVVFNTRKSRSPPMMVGRSELEKILKLYSLKYFQITFEHPIFASLNIFIIKNNR